MQEKTKGMIFFVAMMVIVLLCTIIPALYHAENLPDPLNVIVILSLAYGPLSLMLWYWLHRFYFKSKEKLPG